MFKIHKNDGFTLNSTSKRLEQGFPRHSGRAYR